jgi:hypothetical protein
LIHAGSALELIGKWHYSALAKSLGNFGIERFFGVHKRA